MNPPRRVSLAEAAVLLDVHPATLRRWAKAGRLTVYRVGPRGRFWVRRSEVERLARCIQTDSEETST